MRVIAPLRCRKVQADAKLKALSLRQLAALARVDYHRACRVLRGRERNPDILTRLERAAALARMPKEATA